jgi:glutamine amidotransferase
MITIVNYGLGNVQAIENIYRRINVPVRQAQTAQELEGSKHLILPGVGAFDWAMTRLQESGMLPVMENLVINEGCPVLGICVGMQMLADGSEEGSLRGLGWVPGHVKRFREDSGAEPANLPHMGWNNVEPCSCKCIFSGLEKDARFYFLHSYYFEPKNEAHILSKTNYGGYYASSVRHKRIFGVQFHPEKSHQWGVRLLNNFSSL